MYNKIISVICLLTFSTAVFAGECDKNCKRYCCSGQSSAYGSYYGIGSSMVTWGVLLFVGIALVTALITPNLDTAHADSNTD